jgi:hypothetical protein
MNTALTAQVRSDCLRNTQTSNAALLRRSQAEAKTRAFDDDYGCVQRNGAPLPDGPLIRAVADLDT